MYINYFVNIASYLIVIYSLISPGISGHASARNIDPLEKACNLISSGKHIAECVKAYAERELVLPINDPGRIRGMDCATLSNNFNRIFNVVGRDWVPKPSTIKDCRLFSSFVKYVTGQLPRWASCVNYSKDNEYYEKCLNMKEITPTKRQKLEESIRYCANGQTPPLFDDFRELAAEASELRLSASSFQPPKCSDLISIAERHGLSVSEEKRQIQAREMEEYGDETHVKVARIPGSQLLHYEGYRTYSKIPNQNDIFYAFFEWYKERYPWCDAVTNLPCMLSSTGRGSSGTGYDINMKITGVQKERCRPDPTTNGYYCTFTVYRDCYMSFYSTVIENQLRPLLQNQVCAGYDIPLKKEGFLRKNRESWELETEGFPGLP